MRRVRCMQNYAKRSAGFTLIEVLVSTFLGLLMLSLVMTSMSFNRDVLGRDTVRTRIVQNLRSSLDILGLDVRIVGEHLPSNFPAVELVNGASGAPDTLTVRRSLISQSLPLCTAITAGSAVNQIYFAVPGSAAGCAYSGQGQSYTAWKNYRLAATGQQVKAYIYDVTNKVGEWITYVTEGNTGTSYYITKSAGAWANSYPTASTVIFILEEWTYKINNGVFQVIQNNDNANPLNVSYAITDFQSSILMQDGTTKTAFTKNDLWGSVRSINISLTGSETFRKQNLTKTLTTSLFPRNVLSL
jgi:hypothetical protein